MKIAALALVAAALLATAPAQDRPLTGTWIDDLDSQQGLATDIYLLRDGVYRCESCVPRREYPADGTLRPVSESPRILESVRIVDARTIVTQIVQPGVTRTTRMRVARDGQTARYVSIDRRDGIRGTLRTEYLARRSAAGPAGAHAVSGNWQGLRYVAVPVQLRTTILADHGDGLSYRTGTGFAYTARYDGGYAPIAGPYDGSVSVMIRRLDARRLVETRRRGGADIQMRIYTVAPDGRTMEIATTNLATHSTFRITSRRRR